MQDVLIYNLFPRIAGTMKQWPVHLKRAAEMGFTWVFINSFHNPGFSGSLYAVKDYFAINPLFCDASNSQTAQQQLEEVLQYAHGLGMKVAMDLVINHTAIDCPLVKQHPQWYLRDESGNIVHPFALDNGKKIVWGDLARVDNAGSHDRQSLWEYWLNMACYYLKLGFNGFRCDAAYQVSGDLWHYLIAEAKKRFHKAIFFAETLGCPVEESIKLVEAGFDFTFNSSKWWDFEQQWCLKQYREIANIAGSISFPETHDTDRLFAEMKKNVAAVKMRYAFAAFFSTGILMPIGFEYCFQKRLNVVKTTPKDWENTDLDLTAYIKKVNVLKRRYTVFRQDSPIRVVPVSNKKIFALLKRSKDGRERALIIINKDLKHDQEVSLGKIKEIFRWTYPVVDISPENQLTCLPEPFFCAMSPAQIKVLYSTMS